MVICRSGMNNNLLLLVADSAAIVLSLTRLVLDESVSRREERI